LRTRASRLLEPTTPIKNIPPGARWWQEYLDEDAVVIFCPLSRSESSVIYVVDP